MTWAFSIFLLKTFDFSEINRTFVPQSVREALSVVNNEAL